MSCGEIFWWRSPDIAALLERHGAVEHLVVQFDFVTQAQRDGRAEYSIPGASKSGSGQTGFADIVSKATGEIWEIKPAHLEHLAVKETSHYVKHAQVACGATWRPGTSYSSSNRYGGGGVVYRIEGNGNKAELLAYQGKGGAVLYRWRVNGLEVALLSAYFAWSVREHIVREYFPSGQLQPLPGAKPPNNIPPPKYKPPVLRPDACIPALRQLIPDLIESMRSTCAPTVLEGGAIGILVPAGVWNAIFGPGIVARQVASMQVKTNPTLTLEREAMLIITSVVGLTGVLGIGLALWKALPLAGGVIALAFRGAVAAVGRAVVMEGALASLAAGLRAAAPYALPAGASLVVFVTPRASLASPGVPAGFDVSVARFVLASPGSSAPRVEQSSTLEGNEWFVAGVAGTSPE